MKKLLCIALLAMLVLTACKSNVCQYCGEKDCTECTTFVCDSCQKEKTGRKFKDLLLGQEYYICQECSDGLLGLNGN